MKKFIFSGVAATANQQCIDLLHNAGVKTNLSSKLISGFLETGTGTENEGWIDVSVLTDFCSQNDKSTLKTILFYCSPENYLATNLVLGNDCDNDVKKLLTVWQKETQRSLDFYLPNMQDSLLVNIEHCSDHFDGLVKKINKKFMSKLTNRADVDMITDQEQFSSPLNRITQCLSLNRLIDNYDIQETYEEIASAADLLVDSEDCSFESRVKAKLRESVNILSEFKKNLLDIDRKNDVLAGKYRALKSENELTILQIQQLQEELEAIFTQKSEFESQNIKLETVKSDLECENEIALLQIQQLQEELEFYFIKFQSLSNWNHQPAVLDIQDKRFQLSLELSRLANA